MRPSPKSDPQRNEVYRWEKNFWTIFYGHGMSHRKAHKLARGMSEYYGIRKPKLVWLKLGKSGNTAQADGTHAIEVNTDIAEWTGPAIAHEMAHVITHSYGVLEAPHGPVWLGVYLHLMDKFNIMPSDGLIVSARKSGLKVRPLSQVVPGVL